MTLWWGRQSGEDVKAIFPSSAVGRRFHMDDRFRNIATSWHYVCVMRLTIRTGGEQELRDLRVARQVKRRLAYSIRRVDLSSGCQENSHYFHICKGSSLD